MANNLLSMIQVRTVIQHLQKGSSLRRIAKEFAISRNTVKQYAERIVTSDYFMRSCGEASLAILAAIICPSNCFRYALERKTRTIKTNL